MFEFADILERGGRTSRKDVDHVIAVVGVRHPRRALQCGMRIVWIGCVVLALTGGVYAEAPKPATKAATKPGKDFWKVLVTPKAKWVLRNANAEDAAQKRATVTVETFDVRTIGKAQVARLRWTHSDDSGATTFGGGAMQPTQVAVTAAGLYLLDAEMDDAAVAAALAKKPSRSSPPKAYKGTKQNGGRYLAIRGPEVCMGWARLAEDGPCEDLCESEVCFTAADGVTSISGFDAPDQGIWEK